MKVQGQERNVYRKLGFKINSIPFTRCESSGLLNDIDETFVEEVQQYWEKNYGRRVDPTLNIALLNLTDEKNVKIVPNQIMRREILPFLNDYDMAPSYVDKNLYDIFINPPRSAETVIKNIKGHYFDEDNKSIDIETAEKKLKGAETDLIVKPSRTNNGKKIKKLGFKNGKLYLNGKAVKVQRIERIYKKDFIIQKAIKQHEVMALPHPSSVNTLRMYTMRWNNEVFYISSLARYGVDNDVKDNMGAGGLCLGIKDSGEFYDVALDDRMQTYTHHPTTGVCFADLEPLPDFEGIKQFSVDCHKNILHLNYISWDIAIREDGKPVFIEANFTGPLWIGQLITRKPALGEHTEEVLQYVREKMDTTAPVLMRKDRRREAQKEIKNLEERNKELQKHLEQKEGEIKRLRNSKRWRYASRISSFITFYKR